MLLNYFFALKCSANLIDINLSNFTKSTMAVLNATCSTKMGEEGHEICLGVHIKFHKFADDIFETHAAEYDDNFVVRELFFDIHDHVHANNTIHIGRALDAFLAPRPWWIIVKEKSVERTKHANSILTHHICLIRLYQAHEPHMRMLASIQYPPRSGCESSKLILGHMVSSGWGSHMNYYGGMWGDNPFMIFNIWDSNTNLPDEGVAYVTSTFCPTTINKRLCAFIPLTNCSMPSVLTSLTGASAKNLWPGDLMAYYPATTNGSAVPGNSHDAGHPESVYHKHLQALYGDKLQKNFKTNLFIDGNGKKMDFLWQGHGPGLPFTRTILPSHGFIWRPNSVYRALVTRRVDELRRQQAFPENIDCVAMHIRRGDRINANTNMTAFCKKFRAYSPSNCTTADGAWYNCQDLQDKGCFNRYPFGSLRLRDYLEKAQQLHKTKNVFVVTDDNDWLMEEKKTVGADWHVVVLPARVQSRSHDSPYATENGVDFMASVALAQQCQAFVGHWGSAISHLLFHAMCMVHGPKFDVGRCPKACDLSLPRTDSF